MEGSDINIGFVLNLVAGLALITFILVALALFRGRTTSLRAHLIKRPVVLRFNASASTLAYNLKSPGSAVVVKTVLGTGYHAWFLHGMDGNIEIVVVKFKHPNQPNSTRKYFRTILSAEEFASFCEANTHLTASLVAGELIFDRADNRIVDELVTLPDYFLEVPNEPCE